MNIDDIGCDPGLEDNAPIINEYLRNRRNRSYLYVPGNQYRIGSSIEIPPRYGFKFVGNGFTHSYTSTQNSGGLTGGPASAFVWTGPPDTPMVQYSGYGLVWDGVNLFGKPVPTQGQPDNYEGREAWAGLHITSNRNSIGTGKVSVPQVTIYGCQSGIRLGNERNDKNADNLTMGFYNALSCGAAVRVVGNDSVCHQVNFFRQYFCEFGFDFTCGGKFVCHAVNMAGPGILLNAYNGESTTGTYTLENVWVDNRVVGRWYGGEWEEEKNSRLVTTDRGVSHVVINGLHMPNKPPGVLFELAGNSRLVIRDGFGLRAGLVKARNRMATLADGTRKQHIPCVSLTDCRINGDWVSPNEIFSDTGHGRATWSGCTNWHNELRGET